MEVSSNNMGKKAKDLLKNRKITSQEEGEEKKPEEKQVNTFADKIKLFNNKPNILPKTNTMATFNKVNNSNFQSKFQEISKLVNNKPVMVGNKVVVLKEKDQHKEDNSGSEYEDDNEDDNEEFDINRELTEAEKENLKQRYNKAKASKNFGPSVLKSHQSEKIMSVVGKLNRNNTAGLPVMGMMAFSGSNQASKKTSVDTQKEVEKTFEQILNEKPANIIKAKKPQKKSFKEQ
jgi:hypothetical protein